MAAPIDLRNDFDSVSLRRLAKRTRDATQSRRLLALAEVYDGGSRTDASRIGGVGLQIIRDWVLRFNARGLDGLVDGKSPGAPSKLNADHRRALAEVVEAGPVPAVDGVVRWRRKDLARWLLETFAISLDETTVGRELKALGFAKISARPRHYAQNELAVEAFKRNFPAELAKIRARLPKGVEIELWWQDEARIGQKNKLTRRWARRGTRPRAPRDQRTEWAYIFGAICPAKGKGAGLSPRLTAELTTAMAPMIKRRLRSRWPIFDILPSLGLPPVVCCRGTRPSQAEKSRPRRKLSIGGAKAWSAIAPIWPDPRDRHEPCRLLVLTRAGAELLFQSADLRVEVSDLTEQNAAQRADRSR